MAREAGTAASCMNNPSRGEHRAFVSDGAETVFPILELFCSDVLFDPFPIGTWRIYVYAPVCSIALLHSIQDELGSRVIRKVSHKTQRQMYCQNH